MSTQMYFPIPNKGFFVTFEGVDGCGKSTLIQGVAERLKQENLPIVVTREPGGCDYGNQIRSLLLENRTLDSNAQLLAAYSARLEHIYQVISPGLKKHKIVLCDRFSDSSYAYQVCGEGASNVLFHQLENFIRRYITINLTVFIDIDHETLKHRLHSREQLKQGPFENKIYRNEAYFNALVHGFNKRIEQENHRFVVLDGELSPQELVENTFKEIHSLICHSDSQKMSFSPQAFALRTIKKFLLLFNRYTMPLRKKMR